MENMDEDEYDIDKLFYTVTQERDQQKQNQQLNWLQVYHRDGQQYDLQLLNCVQLKIERLTDSLNHQHLSTLVNTLQNNLLHKQRKQQHRKQSKQINQKSKYQKSFIIGQSKYIIGNPSLQTPTSNTPFQKQYQQLKKQTAMMLITTQHNLTQDRHSLYINSIPDLIKDIIVDSYGTLENIMRKQMGQHTMHLHQHDYHHLILVLYYCSSYLCEYNCITYYKLIQTTYHISQVQLSPEQVANLYLALQQWIIAYRLTCQQSQHNNCQHIIGKPTISLGSSIVRNKNQASIIKARQFSKADREQFRTFINQRSVQIEMLTHYKLNPTVSHITAQLKLKYPDSQHLIGLVEVKNKFHAILRAAYRRMVQLWNMLDSRSQMPPLINLKSHYIEKVLLCAAALKVRLALVDVWLLQPTDSNQLLRKVVVVVIKYINQYLSCNQSNRSKQEQFDEINQARKARCKRRGCIQRAKGISSSTLAQQIDKQ